MNPTNEKQIPNQPETGPEETQLEAEELDAIAGGTPKPLYAIVDY